MPGDDKGHMYFYMQVCLNIHDLLLALDIKRLSKIK